jgi:hypothetical protein
MIMTAPTLWWIVVPPAGGGAVSVLGGATQPVQIG